MASVFFDPTVGGDGSTVSDDSNPTTGLANGGHRARFVPALAQVVAVAGTTVTKAQEATQAAQSAVNAPGTNATSATSLTIGTGSRSFTLAQTGKAFVIGQQVVIANSASPTNWMAGTVTAFNSGTGAMTVNAVLVSGSGTASTWTISVCGAALPVLLLAGGTMVGAITFAAGQTFPGGTMTGAITFAAGQAFPGVLPLAGGTMTGALTLAADPVNNLQAAPKQYVDTAVGSSGEAFSAF